MHNHPLFNHKNHTFIKILQIIWKVDTGNYSFLESFIDFQVIRLKVGTRKLNYINLSN